MRGICKTLEYT